MLAVCQHETPMLLNVMSDEHARVQMVAATVSLLNCACPSCIDFNNTDFPPDEVKRKIKTDFSGLTGLSL